MSEKIKHTRYEDPPPDVVIAMREIAYREHIQNARNAFSEWPKETVNEIVRGDRLAEYGGPIKERKVYLLSVDKSLVREFRYLKKRTSKEIKTIGQMLDRHEEMKRYAKLLQEFARVTEKLAAKAREYEERKARKHKNVDVKAPPKTKRLWSESP